MSTKLEILSAIEARLKNIKTTNDYKTNIGNNVFYWHDLPFEYGETGAITYRDPIEETAENNNYHENNLIVEIEAICFAENSLVKGINLQSDLLKAIGSDPSWNGLSLYTRLLTTEKEVETNGQKAVRVLMTVLINYRNNLWSDSLT